MVVTVVTYRRANLLRRALASVRAQTHSNWHCRVVNDDPEDPEVQNVIDEVGDLRIGLFEPMVKRGASASFNLAFEAQDCDYASLLEDDNWWDPRFLEVMVRAMEMHPEVGAACGNERVWKEQSDGSWKDTGQVIWKESNDELYLTSFPAACGSAKICNSSLLVRRAGREAWLTPDDIPVDVTEHFRERMIPQPLLLVRETLVNYAETLKTHRDTRGNVWGEYQILMIGSVFASLPAPERHGLACKLLHPLHGRPCPYATTLLSTGIAISEARSLWVVASWGQRFRYLLTAVRRISKTRSLPSVRRRRASHWEWLLKSRYNQVLRGGRLER